MDESETLDLFNLKDGLVIVFKAQMPYVKKDNDRVKHKSMYEMMNLQNIESFLRNWEKVSYLVSKF